VTRHGTPDPQITALLRSTRPLVPHAAEARRDGLDRCQRRPLRGARHRQTRVVTGSERMIAPLSPTAPASPKP